MSRKPYIGKSDAQANAEALVRRGMPYTAASRLTFDIKWDWHNREPADLREAVHMVRKAYADEVPSSLHEGPDHIGQDGTPKMTAQAEGYIFGPPSGTDAGRDPETGERDLVGYYHAPFRALLSNLTRGPEPEAKRAAIVHHVTVGGKGPKEAAIIEGVPQWCAKVVAEDALRSFLRSLTDVKVNIAKERAAA